MSAEQMVNSISKAISVLSMFAYENRPLGITEISNKLSLQKANTYKIVKTLEHNGWILQDKGTSKYQIGTSFARIAEVVLSNYDERDFYLAEMQAISGAINEDVVLCVIIDGGLGWCLERVGSENSLIISTRRNDKVTLDRGASGKIMLAHQDKEFIQRVYEANRQYLCPTLEEYEESLAKIREQGYAVTKGELDEGVCAVAVPVFNGKGGFEYSLSVAGPIKRIESKNISEVIALLTRAAKSIATRLSLSGK